jgi:hypothetical protein
VATGLIAAGRARTPAAAAAAFVVIAAIALAGCRPFTPVGGGAPSPVASPSLSATLRLARTEVAGALGAAQVQVRDSPVPIRPGESPLVSAAPRLALQAIVPAAPDGGYIVVYEFPDPGAATTAAREYVGYIASGPGRVQFANDARFVVRQLGAALVFFAWSPGVSSDPEGEQRVATALGSLGTGYDVPS